MKIDADAMARFTSWWNDAQKCGLKEPTAVTLATADKQGRPSARTVLLKGFDENGFVFFTNFESRKGQQLAVNPRAALCFYWPPLERQVQVEGDVTPVSTREADAYWNTRARDSQIGAWASQQSRPLKDRGDLEQRVREFSVKFGSEPIPRPPYWSGWRVMPDRLEFWTARPFRLHERLVFTHQNGSWSQSLLNP